MISTILLIISLNIDAAFVGLSYGIRRIKVPISSIAILTCISVCCFFASFSAGQALGKLLPSEYAKLIGCFILFAIGGYAVVRELLGKAREMWNRRDGKSFEQRLLPVGDMPCVACVALYAVNKLGGAGTFAMCDFDGSRSISGLEAVALAFAISFDSMGVGIAMSLNAAFAMSLPFILGLSQAVFLYFGIYIGKRTAKVVKLNKTLVNLLCGALLITLGALRLFE